MNTAINVNKSELTQQDLINSLELAHRLNKEHNLYEFMKTLLDERDSLEKND